MPTLHYVSRDVLPGGRDGLWPWGAPFDWTRAAKKRRRRKERASAPASDAAPAADPSAPDRGSDLRLNAARGRLGRGFGLEGRGPGRGFGGSVERDGVCNGTVGVSTGDSTGGTRFGADSASPHIDNDPGTPSHDRLRAEGPLSPRCQLQSLKSPPASSGTVRRGPEPPSSRKKCSLQSLSETSGLESEAGPPHSQSPRKRMRSLKLQSLQNSLSRLAGSDRVGREVDGGAPRSSSPRKRKRAMHRTVKSFADRVADLEGYKLTHGTADVDRKLDPSLANFVSNVRYARRNLDRGDVKGHMIALDEERVAMLDAIGFDWRSERRRKGGSEGGVENGAKEEPERASVAPPPVAMGPAVGAERAEGRADVEGETEGVEEAQEVDAWGDPIDGLPDPSSEVAGAGAVDPTDPAGADDGGNRGPASSTAAAGERGGEGPDAPPPRKSREDRFFSWVALLRAHKEKRGHFRVSAREDPALARFCVNVRMSRRLVAAGKSGPLKLTEGRIAALDALGFDWNAQRKTFEDRLEDLEAFRAKHGHLDVTPKADLSLYQYVCNLRKRKNFRQEHKDALDAIGFDWEQSAAPQGENENDASAVPKENLTSGIDGSRVGQGAQEQGPDDSRPSSPLLGCADAGNEGVDLLGPGEVGNSDDSMLSEESLCDDRPVPCGLINPSENREQDMDVASPVGTLQRQAQQPLNPLPSNSCQDGATRPKNTFSMWIDRLVAFKKLHGHLNVTPEVDLSLDSFCINVRYARQNSTKSALPIVLTKERIAALEAIGFDWAKKTKVLKRRKKRSFEEMVEHLRIFYEKHGHFDVTENDDQPLAGFCRTLRNGEMKLNEGRAASLNAIGFNCSYRIVTGRASGEHMHKDQPNVQGGNTKRGSLTEGLQSLRALASEMQTNTAPSARRQDNGRRFQRGSQVDRNGNLQLSGYGPTTTNEEIRALFAPFVQVSGIMRMGCFCFVNTDDPEGAKRAREALDGCFLGGAHCCIKPVSMNARNRTNEGDGPGISSLRCNSLPRNNLGQIDYDEVKDMHGNPASKNLYVRGYGPSTTRPQLKELFAQHATVESVVMNGNYSFVNTTDRDDAVMARHSLQGRRINGGAIIVNFGHE